MAESRSAHHQAILLQLEMLSQLFDVLGIIQQSPPRLRRAPSRAWPVRSDQAYIQLACRLIPDSSLYTCCGETVKEEDGSPCRRAVLCVAERAAVGEDHGGGSVVACVVAMCGVCSVEGSSTEGSMILAT